MSVHIEHHFVAGPFWPRRTGRVRGFRAIVGSGNLPITLGAEVIAIPPGRLPTTRRSWVGLLPEVFASHVAIAPELLRERASRTAALCWAVASKILSLVGDPRGGLHVRGERLPGECVEKVVPRTSCPRLQAARADSRPAGATCAAFLFQIGIAGWYFPLIVPCRLALPGFAGVGPSQCRPPMSPLSDAARG